MKYEYPEEAKEIWRTQVPPSGQSKTMQGELIRAIEKLRDQASRNGNCNWDEGHEILAEFIKDTLLSSDIFSASQRADIMRDFETIMDYDHPLLEDEDPYDRLTILAVLWSKSQLGLIPRSENPKLTR